MIKLPWYVAKSSECPASKPWAVINKDTGSIRNRCHASKAGARSQAAAMYASMKDHKMSEAQVEEATDE